MDSYRNYIAIKMGDRIKCVISIFLFKVIADNFNLKRCSNTNSFCTETSSHKGSENGVLEQCTKYTIYLSKFKLIDNSRS